MALTNNYITWERAAASVGVAVGDLSDALKDAIIEQVEYLDIDSEYGMSFYEQSQVGIGSPELHSAADDQDFITLRNFPVVSVERLRDNVLSTVASSILTLVEHTNFEIQKDTGIITLIPDLSDTQIMRKIAFFTAGVNTIDVAYTYGFSAAPDDIKAYADLLASKLIRSWYDWDNSSGGGGAESFTMGDYTEKVGEWSASINKVIDPTVKKMRIHINSKYKNFVPLGTGSMIGL